MSKIEADGLRKIDVHFLKKQGFFSDNRLGTIQWTSSFGGSKGSTSLQSSTTEGGRYVRIRCSQANDDLLEGYEREISLLTTACHYGGVRYWLECPTWGCRRRVGTLYFACGHFACRHCFNLTYGSRNQSKRYNGFISFPMIDAAYEKAKRMYYRGKLTKKYRKYVSLQERCLAQMGMSGQRFSK